MARRERIADIRHSVSWRQREFPLIDVETLLAEIDHLNKVIENLENPRPRGRHVGDGAD